MLFKIDSYRYCKSMFQAIQPLSNMPPILHFYPYTFFVPPSYIFSSFFIKMKKKCTGVKCGTSIYGC